MNAERHREVMDVFLAASQLAPDRRDAFLDETCGNDRDLRQEVDSLLKHHVPTTITKQTTFDTLPNRDVRRRRAEGRRIRRVVLNPWKDHRRAAAALLVLVLCIGGLASWAYIRIRGSLRQSLATQLITVLDADVKALEQWITREKENVESWANNQEIRRQVVELVTISRESASPQHGLLQSPAYAELMKLLEPVRDRQRNFGISVVSGAGLCLAHSESHVVGALITPQAGAILHDILVGKTVLVTPTLERKFVADFETEVQGPMMAVAAPVRAEDGTIVAALAFAFDADDEFTRILSIAQLGETGETYAFDSRGVLLSNLRRPNQLKAAGLIPREPTARDALNMTIQDPGRDLTTAPLEATEPYARQLTKMVASAVRDHVGMDLDGYRNYLGIPVIGAWKWLSDDEFGVGTEITVQEAYAPLRYLETAFLCVISVAALFAVATAFSSVSVLRLRRQVHEARQLGQYTLVELIGQGGMGKVFRAKHAMLQRPTAVKLLDGAGADRESVERFQREVELTSQLTHPNTIQVYDYGLTPDGVFYYAMEYLPGVTLGQLVALDGAIAPARVIHILRQACASLKEAHERGLVHRDVKPANIMLCERGGLYDVVKVLDFGMARSIQPRDGKRITKSWQVGGTPLYIAPERLQDPLIVDGMSDLYSLGSVAFYLVTGQNVFDGADVPEIIRQVVSSMPPRPSSVVGTRIPPELDDIIFSCLAKDPGQRPASAAVMMESLDRLAQRHPWTQDDAQRWWQERASSVANNGLKPVVNPARVSATV